MSDFEKKPPTESVISDAHLENVAGHTAVGNDVAARFLASLDREITDVPITEAEANSVRRKVDLTILPLLAFTVWLGAMDKVIIGNAAIFGMRKDLHLTGSEYSWIGSIFYLGSLFFEWPTALLIQKMPVGKLFSIIALCWAILLFGTAGSQSFAGLAAVRFLMGCTEAGIFPLASIIAVMWYTKREQPIRAALLYTQVATIMSAALTYGIGHTHTKVAQWRLLFIIAGGMSLLWAVLLFIFLPDSPTTAWYYTKRQRYVCVKRIESNNTGMEDKQIRWYQVRECVLDPKTWLLFIFSVAQNIPNAGIITFGSIIVNGLGYDPLKTSLIGLPTGAIATIWQILLAIPCAKLRNKRCMIIATANIVPMVSAILMWKLPRSNKLGLLGAYYAFYTYWGPYVMSMSLPMANSSGHTKKITLTVVYFLGYVTGSVIGPQVFRASDAPNYSKGYTGLLACFVAASATIILYGSLCKFENVRRNKKYGYVDVVRDLSNQEAIEETFSDKTDKEKPDFRYVY